MTNEQINARARDQEGNHTMGDAFTFMSWAAKRASVITFGVSIAVCVFALPFAVWGGVYDPDRIIAFAVVAGLHSMLIYSVGVYFEHV